MIRTAVKEARHEMTKTRFVLRDSSDTISCMAGKRRAFGETDKGKCDEGTAYSSRRTGASSSRKKLDLRLVVSVLERGQ